MEKNEIFEKLFNELDTYEALPEMINKAVSDCVRSEYDILKEHAICYHTAGIINIVNEIKKSFKELDNEMTILDIDIESEMEEEIIEKFKKLKEFLKTF